MYKAIIKPGFDFVAALFAVLLLSPVFILVSLAIVIDSGGPVFFKQERLGLHGSVFMIIKFRSMVSDQRNHEKPTKIYESDPRITRVGKFLRRSSLDEIPQLLNIIKGEMSFIGPRPPLTWFPKELDAYSEFEKRRFLVKPGISGLAQITCREIHDWDVKFPIDVEYVEKTSLLYDLGLFLRSFSAFFKTGNVYRKDEP